jgi:hypothetical protein
MVAIGDPGQLASVQAGGWLGAVGRTLGAQQLTEVMRQRDPAERRALGALHDGHPQRYLDWAEHNRRIETFSDPAGACEQALAEWARAPAAAGPAQTVMIARDNDTRDRLNQGARELRRGLGALGEEHSYGPVEVAVGDRVICRRNDGQLDVDNGMRGTVRHLDPDRVVIDTDGGLVRELPVAYVAEHVEHAYSLTGHGMQGGTIESAIVVASPRDLTAGWSYTALSRARETTRLLVYDDDLERERSEFAPTDQTPAATRHELLDRVARRMQERDDEDLAIEQLPGAGRADDPMSPAREHTRQTHHRSTPPLAQSRRRRLRRSQRGCGSCASASIGCTCSLRRYRHASFSASRTSTRAPSPSPASTSSSPSDSPACPTRSGASDVNRTPTPSNVLTWPASCKPISASSTPCSHSATAWSASSATPSRPASNAKVSKTRSPKPPGSKLRCATSSPSANCTTPPHG